MMVGDGVMIINTDKRNVPRFYGAIRIAVSVILGGKSKRPEELAPDQAMDISETGMRFLDESGLPEGAMLEVFIMPDGVAQPIRQLARVRWAAALPDRRVFEIGVEFVETKQADHAVWIDYVRQRQLNCAMA
jgi:c-di-GMP-binding flagellar brake protein YcgR